MSLRHLGPLYLLANLLVGKKGINGFSAKNFDALYHDKI